jgi:serine/threonine protein kinase
MCVLCCRTAVTDSAQTNIFIDDGSRAVLADFGLIVVGQNTIGALRTLQDEATAAWAAPERLDSATQSARPDFPGDVYSFGHVCLMVRCSVPKSSYPPVNNGGVSCVPAEHPPDLPPRSSDGIHLRGLLLPTARFPRCPINSGRSHRHALLNRLKHDLRYPQFGP